MKTPKRESLLLKGKKSAAEGSPGMKRGPRERKKSRAEPAATIGEKRTPPLGEAGAVAPGEGRAKHEPARGETSEVSSNPETLTTLPSPRGYHSKSLCNPSRRISNLF